MRTGWLYWGGELRWGVAVGSGGGERGLRGGMRRCEQYYARGDVGEKRGE